MNAVRALPFLLALAACTTGEQVHDLHEGMSPAQVESAIGKPDGFQRDGRVVSYQYTNRMISGWGWDRADYYAVFVDDRLASWGAGTVREKSGPAIGTVFAAPVNVN